MALERTLSIVKPDGVARNLIGQVLSRFEKAGLRVVAARMQHLSQRDAEGFYAVHAARPFFGDLVKFMTEGKILALVLEGDDAIARWRALMGPTDAAKAPKDTIRGEFGQNVERNATHGSDAPETAAFEVGWFFAGIDLA